MTAEAGECNGRIDGSKVELELKMGADLRDDGDNGEEIGGSFVIVNGDSDDHSERDLDLRERLENKETVVKESFVEGGVKNEIFNGGDGDLVVERSNGGGTEHISISGLSSDMKIEEGFDGDGVKVDNLVDKELGSLNVAEENQEGHNDLGSLNVAEENQEGEALVVDAEEKEEVGQPEDDVENHSKVELGSQVEMEDTKEPEIVITETGLLEKSDLASKVDDNDPALSNGVEEKKDSEVLFGDPATHLDEQKSQVVMGESDFKVISGSEVEKDVITETDPLDNSDSASQVDDNVLGSLSDVKEKQNGKAYADEAATHPNEQESEVVNSESNSNLELGSEVEKEHAVHLEDAVVKGDRFEQLEPVSQVEEDKEPIDDEEAARLVKARESREPVDGVEESVEDMGSAVEAELEPEPHTVVETVDAAKLELPVELNMRQEGNTWVAEAENLAEVESATEIELKQGSDFRVEEIDNLAEVESAAEVQLKKKPDTKIEETGKDEVREGKELEILTEEIGNQGEMESDDRVEAEQEPEAVSDADDKIEVEETKEPDVVAEQMTSEDFPDENEEARIPNTYADAATDEPSAQLENGKTGCGAEVSEEINAISDVVVAEQMTSEDPHENEEARMPNIDADAPTDEPSAQLENGKTGCGAEVREEIIAISDVAVAEQMTSEDFPHENEEARMPHVDADAPTDEPSALIGNGKIGCGAEVSGEIKAISDVVVAEQRTPEDFPHENEEARMPHVDADAPTDEPSSQLENGKTGCGAEVSVEFNAISDVVVAEQMTSKHFLHEGEEARMSNVEVDTPTGEPSAQLENGNMDCAADESEETSAICYTSQLDYSSEVGADSLKVELNDEATNINLEVSERPNMCPDSEKEMIAEVSLSTVDEDGEVEVNNGETSPSELKTDISGKDVEPSSLSFNNGADQESRTKKMCSNKDVEIAVKDSAVDTESNKVVAVNENQLETESGTEGSECMVSSVDGEQSNNKDDDDKEPSHEQVQAAEIMQTTPEAHVVKRQHVYIIKVPRLIDDELQKKIQHARSIIDEKTRIRDSIGEETRAQGVIVNKFSLDYKAALAKERAARAISNAKRQEVENLQALINRINNANSIAEIDEKIRSMSHRQQHETISLKQEKQYIHDISQMMRLREQLLSKKLGQEQIDETLSKRDEIEAKYKNLKKEADSLRTALSAAESSTKSAWNKYMDEEQRLRSLKEKHNEADAVRQEAYLHWKKLKIQLAEKAKHFRMFKDDQAAAMKYVFSGDNQGLQSHCGRQVERIMNMWNNNSEFREQYVKSNTYSTLRRLGTSDGRSLGPGEQAPILRSYVDKSPKIDSPPSSNTESPSPVLVSDVKQGKLTETSASPSPVLVSAVKQGKLTETSTTKQVARTNQSAKLKSSTNSVVEGSIPAVSNGEDLKETKKENEMNKEEGEMAKKAEELARKAEELARKEEELRKEKAAAELKERLRLEQKAKAREAEERKRRKAEKAQARAEYRAQKEAELKEKKKAKKEIKKSGLLDTDTTYGGTEGGGTPAHDANPMETSQEPEASSVATTMRRKSSRPASSVKQYNKVQPPVPLPLRKRGKRKMMAWIWAAVVTLLVLALFLAGNYISFSTSRLPYFEF